MKMSTLFSTTAGVVGCLLIAGPAVAQVKEPAVLKGPAGTVNSLSFSANGSRLVSANGGIVWDVAEQRQVCACKGTEGFQLAWLSSDGQTVLAGKGLSGRISNGESSQTVVTGLGNSFRVLNAKTGDELFAVPALGPGSMYTAVAMSRDGVFVALASNEWLGGSRGTTRRYSGGAITVWDVKAKKVKWKISGVEEEKTARINVPLSLKGEVNWLAFSPNASKLAAMNKSLQVFALDPDKETPTSIFGEARPTGFVLNGYTVNCRLEWRPDGKGILFHSERDVLLFEAESGNRQDQRTLVYARRPAADQSGDRLPLPDSGDPNGGALEGWDERQITMSLDGSRLAAHIVGHDKKENGRSNAVVIWDVQARRQIGFLLLPNQKFAPPAISRVAGARELPARISGPRDRSYDVRIALSGDGKRLAVGNAVGEVRVFDVAQSVANTKNDGP